MNPYDRMVATRVEQGKREDDYWRSLRRAVNDVLASENKYQLNDALESLHDAYHPRIRVKMGRA